MSPAPGRRVERRFRLYELPLLLGLVLLWMMLWGEISWMSFGSGILIALLATRLYYLPPVEL
ncbi:cation:proton antiporter, partial [Leucobacter sp. OLES1]